MKMIHLADVKSVSGKGRLTDVMTNKIQYCFGQYTRNNESNLQRMQNDIWAKLKYIVQDDLNGGTRCKFP